ncbi:MAG: hypothetical protein BAJATHORv1_70105 [Candidatus Thorarchaeota archaeon]|nr:MAG: hypothetical protein BAJATHORv1_70105 [Candidatus Thorarchaeota archaeon]
MTSTLKTIDDIISRCFSAPLGELESLSEVAFDASRRQFNNKIFFYAPGMVHYETEFHRAADKYRFPSISITGEGCALNCEHCNGQLLTTMHAATTPDALWNFALEIHRHEGTGCLISGGSTPSGNTPLIPFIPIIKRMKEELDLDIVVHTGLVLPEIAEALGTCGIDGAMLDIIGSNSTLREIYHLNLSIEVFDMSMQHLQDYNIPFIPHIIAGLHHGRLLGEDRAIKMIAKYNPHSVVVVAFMPLENTPMSDVTPASPSDIMRVILATRFAIPDRPLVLGCARPLGEHRRELDQLAIDVGVNGIAYPTEEGYQYANDRGLSIQYTDQCCSLIYREF